MPLEGQVEAVEELTGCAGTGVILVHSAHVPGHHPLGCLIRFQPIHSVLRVQERRLYDPILSEKVLLKST